MSGVGKMGTCIGASARDECRMENWLSGIGGGESGKFEINKSEDTGLLSDKLVHVFNKRIDMQLCDLIVITITCANTAML